MFPNPGDMVIGAEEVENSGRKPNKLPKRLFAVKSSRIFYWPKSDLRVSEKI